MFCSSGELAGLASLRVDPEIGDDVVVPIADQKTAATEVVRYPVWFAVPLKNWLEGRGAVPKRDNRIVSRGDERSAIVEIDYPGTGTEAISMRAPVVRSSERTVATSLALLIV